MTQNARFVHLGVHSEYSLIDSIIRVKPLVHRVRELEMPAVAVTDVANIYGSLKFYKAALGSGIKPIIGVDAWVANPESTDNPYRVSLLAQNEDGYKRLCRLISRAWLEGHTGTRACIERSWLLDDCDGLIALSGFAAGEIGKALESERGDVARALLNEWTGAFGDRFYLELSRTGASGEDALVERSVDLAVAASVPVVATNRAVFLSREEFDAHEVRVCIHEGRVIDDQRRPRRYTEEQYLKSPAEMTALFADIPEALANTVEIARRCNTRMEIGVTHLPNFPIEEDISEEDELVRQAREGLDARFAIEPVKPRVDSREEYDKRLQYEIDVINRMGFAGYFLIVADFIKWSRDHDIPVGPGRGSGAGSLVAYSIGITDLDPLEHGLLFERFLNPERVSMPDFDIDFCMDGRDKVIDYVARRYGRDKVSQIITHGTMAARAVVRDVGRVMALPFYFVDELAKLVPFEVGMTLTKALSMEPELVKRREKEEDVADLLETALVLEGLSRNVGKHAGGVVIAPSTLTEFTALYAEAGSEQAVTQFDMDDLADVGLVKFDFLGLRTLTIIDKTLKLVNAARAKDGEDPIIIEAIPLDDDATYKMIQDCYTTGVFQLESRGMTDVVRQLKPDRFDDLVALVALYRPGPLGSGMVDTFINRKHGREETEYPHELIEPILKPTYGVILYQEQVMQIAQVLSGYSLGSADVLRKAMGKKNPEVMAKQRAGFVDGALKNDVEADVSGYIFDLVEKFAGYGFNKSHSAAYALISYQTAWLKCHYPASFMAASFSSDMENTDRVVTLMNECRVLDMPVYLPDVNKSELEFKPEGEKGIRFGLGGIKGVGSAAIEQIVETREADGDIKDIFDFCKRVDSRKANRKVLEALIRAGAMDSFEGHRAAQMACVTLAMTTADQQASAESAGQNDLFGMEQGTETAIEMPEAEAWDEQTELSNEKLALGVYLSGHPMNAWRNEVGQLIGGTLADLNPGPGSQKTVVAGFLSEIRTRNTQKGKMAFLTLDDGTALLDVTVFTALFGESSERIKSDQLVIIEGSVGIDDRTGSVSMRAEAVHDIESAQGKWLRAVGIELEADAVDQRVLDALEQTLSTYRGGHCSVIVSYRSHDGSRVRLRLGQDWRMRAGDGMVDALRDLVGADHVRVRYGTEDADRAHSTDHRAPEQSPEPPPPAQGEVYADDYADYAKDYSDIERSPAIPAQSGTVH